MWNTKFKRPARKPVSNAPVAVISAAFESLEERRLMSTYGYTVTVNSYAVGITSGHDTGSGSLAATAVSIDGSAPPSYESVLQAALTQAGVTLTATHTAQTSGSYSGSGTSASDRLLFLTAEDTGKNYAGTTSHEASLADAKGLAGDYVLGFEDGTDFDFNDGYFLVTITPT